MHRSNDGTRTLAWVSALLAGATMAGCSSAAPPPDAARPVDAACSVPTGTSLPWLVVGTGVEGFEPLTDGDAIELVHGPQGGFHVYGAAVFDLEGSPNAHVLRYDLLTVDGTTLATTQIALSESRLVPACGGWLRSADLVVFASADPTSLVGTELDLVAQLLDGSGAIAADRRHLTLVDDVP